MDVDSGYVALKSLVAECEKYRGTAISEADTRAKFITRFLIEVLGWREEHIVREECLPGSREAYDYMVGDRVHFLVEAKREAEIFELPDRSGKTRYKLSGAIQSKPTIWSAITQAQRYCSDHGVQFAIATNGIAYCFFEAMRIGSSWKEGDAFVFDIFGLEHSRFSDIYNALSCEKFCAPSVRELIATSPEAKFCKSVAEDAPQQIGRLQNDMSGFVEQTLGLALRDKVDPTEDFVRRTYTNDTDLEYYEKELKDLLGDAMPVFARDVMKLRPGHKKDPFKKTLFEDMNASVNVAPIVLIGGKGVGKTTFLKWSLRLSDVRDQLKGSIVSWLDFREIPEVSADLETRIRKDLCDDIENHDALGLDTLNHFRQVFRERLDREKKIGLAPYLDDEKELARKEAELIEKWRDDPFRYFESLVSYVTQHCEKRLILVFDNCDQKSSRFQETLLAIAQEIAAAFPIIAIISLRENTYFSLSHSPTTDAFSSQRVFHVQAPSLRPVLEKRLAYLLQELEGREFNFTSANGVALTVSDTKTFVALLERSLLTGKDSSAVIEFLECIANRGVRDALGLIYQFLVSGHTDMSKYFWSYAEDKTTTIPFHEFLGSVLLGEMSFFRETKSRFFLNIFARTSHSADSNFTRLRILRAVRKMSIGNSQKPEDYIHLTDLYREFQTIGIPEHVLTTHFRSLLKCGLLASDSQSIDLDAPGALLGEEGSIRSVHLSAAGHYYVYNMSQSFAYVSRIIPDVPIVDQGFYSDLQMRCKQELTSGSKVPVASRIAAVKKFCEYLKFVEAMEVEKQSVLRSQIIDHDLAAGITSHLDEEMAAITNRIARA